MIEQPAVLDKELSLASEAVVKIGCNVCAVTIDGQDMKLSNGWFEDSWTYGCQTGGSVTVLWQLYRPLLGNTVEITTG